MKIIKLQKLVSFSLKILINYEIILVRGDVVSLLISNENVLNSIFNNKISNNHLILLPLISF